MFVDVVYVYIETLRCLTKAFRIFVLWTGIAHHDHIIAELHRSVIDLTVGTRVLSTVLRETKGFRQKL